MSALNAMTLCDNIKEQLIHLHSLANRISYTMQDLMEGYFHSPYINPDDKDTLWALASQFKRNTARAEIVEDAILQLRYSLEDLDADCRRLSDLSRGAEGKAAAGELKGCKD